MPITNPVTIFFFRTKLRTKQKMRQYFDSEMFLRKIFRTSGATSPNAVLFYIIYFTDLKSLN